MIQSVDAYLLLAGAAFGFAAAAVLFVLRPPVATPATPENGLHGAPRHARPLRYPAAGVVREAPADGEAAPAVGPHSDLAAEVAELRHAFKLLQNEWSDKESRMDALIKRAWRLHKIHGGAAGTDGDPTGAPAPAPVLSAAEQRAAIVRRYRGGE